VFVLLVAILSAVILASPAAASSGLVGSWPMDEGSGTTVHDHSGFGNDGVLSGSATWDAPSGLSFDGQPGQVKIIDDSVLEPATAVTVSAWVKHEGSPGQYRYIFAKGATGCVAASYALYTAPSGGLEFYVAKGLGSPYVGSPDAGTRVWDGRWHLVVGTFDGTAVRLFVDGTQVGSGTSDTSPLVYRLPDSNDAYIGNYPGCQQHAFLGAIQDVDIYNGALTSAEVTDLLPNGATSGGPLTPPSAPGSGQTNTGTGTGTGTGAAGGSPQSGSPGSGIPSLTGVHLSGTTLLIGTTAALSRDLRTGLTISYTDRLGSQVTFTVVRLVAGVRVRQKCLAPPRRRAGHLQLCTRPVVVGSFTHNDRPGRTALRFTGLPGRRLTPGRYRVILIPHMHGRMGSPVVLGFSVKRGG
jgi:hypothetical protein